MGFDSRAPGNEAERPKREGELSESDVDELLRTLADSRCRHLVGYLASTDDRAVSVDDVAAYVSNATDAPLDTTRVSLYHHHLPRCDEIGLVDYEEEADRIVYDDDDPLVEEILEAAAEATGSYY